MSTMTRITTKTLLSFSACVLLAACQSGYSPEGKTQAERIDTVLEQAANSAYAHGGEPLPLLEKMYKRNPQDPVTATKYAHALREANHPNRAAIVLSPFAHMEDSAPEVKAEFSAIQLALGHYTVAEEFAQKAILQSPKHHQAYHYLGIALDAQGEHKPAERAFRKGLDFWQGDPTTIMNNLALNLTSQGFLDEAEEILQRAAAISPDRIEVERNLRIVMALKQSHRYDPPKPGEKPERSDPN